MICKTCKLDLPDSEFYTRRNNFNEVRPYGSCKPCHKAVAKAWRDKNPDRKRRPQPKEEVYEKRAEKYEFVKIAKDVPCLDCGGRFPQECMDFDHVRGEKLGNIGVMVWKGASIQKVQAEIEKCEVICSNCHRIRTRKRMQDGSPHLRPPSE